MRKTTKLLAAVPVLALGVGLIVLASGAFASGNSDLSAPAVGRLPAKLDTNGTTPEGLSPSVTARDWQETGALGPSLAALDGQRTKGFAETVREYLQQELIQHPDAERQAILAIADELLKDFES